LKLGDKWNKIGEQNMLLHEELWGGVTVDPAFLATGWLTDMYQDLQHCSRLMCSVWVSFWSAILLLKVMPSKRARPGLNLLLMRLQGHVWMAWWWKSTTGMGSFSCHVGRSVAFICLVMILIYSKSYW
jgi:hypothetical protein